MTRKTTTEDVTRLEKALSKAVEEGDAVASEDLLTTIRATCFSLPTELLCRHPITRTVGKLRKHPEASIKEKAATIVRQWKNLLEVPPKKKTASSSSSSSSSSSFSFDAYSITFCDRAENHAGMQMIGDLRDRGFSVAELEAAASTLTSQLGVETEVHHLEDLLSGSAGAGAGGGGLAEDKKSAAVLVIRGGVGALLAAEAKERSEDGVEDEEEAATTTTTTTSADALLQETRGQRYDTKALMGRGSNRTVKNKHARHNNCIADFAQEPDYAAGKGTVVAFNALPILSRLRRAIGSGTSGLGPQAAGLVAEVNKYFDVRQCGIGWHGDAERRVVVGVRLGHATDRMPLKFQWFQKSQPLGAVLEIPLSHGDMYVMSQKATGFDWMTNRKGRTLRHAAGADKYARNKDSSVLWAR
jgi:hypothetical protein